jgi:hypothetical protein
MTKRKQRRPDDDDDDDDGGYDETVEAHLEDFLDTLHKNSSTETGKRMTQAEFNDVVRDALNSLEVKRRMVELRSFSKVRWRDIARRFNLDPARNWHQFDHFTIPKVTLPPSFHRKVMLDSAQWLDVYRERDDHEYEAACVRLFEAVCTYDGW